MGVVLSYYTSPSVPATSLYFNNLSEVFGVLGTSGLLANAHENLLAITVRIDGKIVDHYDLTDKAEVERAREDAAKS